MTRNKYIFISIGWCLSIAFIYGLSRGDFVGGAYDAALLRTTDFQAPVLLNSIGALSSQHPAYAALAKISGHTFPAALLKALLALKMDFYITVAIAMVFFRTLALLAVFPWLRWVGAPRWSPFLLAPLLLGVFWVQAYGYVPLLTICGEITVSLFLLACGALLFRWHKTSLMFWLLQAWTHPSTFLSWALLYGALWLHVSGALEHEKILKRLPPRVRAVKINNFIYAILAATPVAGGGAMAFLEAAGIIDMHGGTYYWDFVAALSTHSLFGGALDMARIPISYLLMVGGLFCLSVPMAPVPKRLHFINRCVASIGLSFYCIQVLYVESHLSILANMLLPLRFEALLFIFFLFNIFSILFAKREECDSRAWYSDNIGIFCVACGFFITLFTLHKSHNALYFFPFSIYICIIFIELVSKTGNNTFKKKNIAVAIIFLLLFIANCYMLSPKFSSMFNDIYLLAMPPSWLLKIILISILSLVIAKIFIRANTSKIFLSRLCSVILLVSFFYVYEKQLPQIYDPEKIKTELSLLIQGVRAGTLNSPWNDFFVWQKKNIPPGDKILVYPALFLNLLGIPGVSVQADTANFSLYLPREATPLAEQLHHIFNIDIAYYAKKGAKVYDLTLYSITGEGWDYAKRIYLGSGSASESCRWEHPEKLRFQWVAEPITGFDGKKIAASYPEYVVFENAVIRIYAVTR